MSGLNQRFTKPSALNWARGFESHFLRIKIKRVYTAVDPFDFDGR